MKYDNLIKGPYRHSACGCSSYHALFLLKSVSPVTGARHRSPSPEPVTLKILSFSPDKGAPGDSVIITGERFGTIQEGLMVKFGSATANILSAGATQIVVAVPQIQPGNAPVTVTAGGKTANARIRIVVPL